MTPSKVLYGNEDVGEANSCVEAYVIFLVLQKLDL